MKRTTDCHELALKKVKISGDVIGKFGIFELEQKFVNNTKKVLEVGYTFPVPYTATVVGFEVLVGDKLLKGQCKETQKAKKEYAKNIVKGNSAYLMEEKSDNIFTISIGKIAKGEEVNIKIKFIDSFSIVDNQIQVLIPTLVPPKYNCEITDKLSYGKVDYSIDFSINVLKNLKVNKITSPTNVLKFSEDEENLKINVLNFDLSKDFKLNIDLKEELTSTGLCYKGRDGEDILYLSFMPEIQNSYEDSEKDYIFIVDVSGSMEGEKLEETKRAVIECLKQLDTGDKFNIIPFENFYESMSPEPLEYNDKNLEKAINYVNALYASGGTEIFEPLKYVLSNQKRENVILLFTDGEVGEESTIISFVEENIQNSRLFAFGIDYNVNSYFIDKLAKAGNGKGELIMPDEKIDEKIIRTFARIQTPLIENLRIDYGNNKVLDEIKEDKVLFNYEFYNAFVKVEKFNDNISLKGNIYDKEYSWIIKNVINSRVDLAVLFAKQEIDRLEEYIQKSNDEDITEAYKNLIIELSEKYNINSKYTSFLTVYERENKILELPKYQETKLSRNFLPRLGSFLTSSMGDADDDMFDCIDDMVLFSDELIENSDLCIDDGPAKNLSISTPRTFEDLINDLKAKNNHEKVRYNACRIFHSDFIPKEIPHLERLKSEAEYFMRKPHPLLVNLLYGLYGIISDPRSFKLFDFIEYIRENLSEIQADDKCMKIVCSCYNFTENSKLLDMIPESYRKHLKIKDIVDIELDTSEISIMAENKEENLDKILWYLTKIQSI